MLIYLLFFCITQACGPLPTNGGIIVPGPGPYTETPPQPKYVSNLKKLKPSSSSLNHSPNNETNDIGATYENIENINIHNAPIIIKNSSAKNSPTKYIFLKSDEKPPQHPHLQMHQHQSHAPENLTMNRSNTISNIKYEGFNSASFASDLSKNTNNSDFRNSMVNGDYITSLASYNSNNSSNVNTNSNSATTNANSNTKNIAMSTVNQLVALKDVNYYLTNSSKHMKKLNGQMPISYSQTGTYPSNMSTSNGNGKPNMNSQNVNNQVTEIKLRTNNMMSESDFRRTHSALPLLRNGFKIQNNNANNSSTNANFHSVNSNGNGNGNSNGHSQMGFINANFNSNNSSSSNNNSSTSGNNNNNSSNVSTNRVNSPVDLKNGIKGINTTISYKLVNTPMINSLTRAKSFLYNQNATTNVIDRRLRGGSIEKTSL